MGYLFILTVERQSNEAGDGGELSEEDKARYTKYIQRAKRLVEEGEIAQAVLNNKKALQIYHTVKLARKIKKMEVCIVVLHCYIHTLQFYGKSFDVNSVFSCLGL